MHKSTWTTLFIVGLSVVLLVFIVFGSFTQLRESTGNAVVALSHSAQDVGAIDVYIDRNLVIEGLQLTDQTFYTQVAPGNHIIDVVPSGDTVILIKTTEMAFEADHAYQLTLDGLKADWSVALEVADETRE